MHNLFSASGNLSKGVTLGLTSADGAVANKREVGSVERGARSVAKCNKASAKCWGSVRGGSHSSLADGSCRLSSSRSPSRSAGPKLVGICLSPSLGISKSFCLPTFHNENAVALRSVVVLELLLPLLLPQLLNN